MSKQAAAKNLLYAMRARQEIAEREKRNTLHVEDSGRVDARQTASLFLTPEQAHELRIIGKLEFVVDGMKERITREVAAQNGRALDLEKLTKLDGSVEVRGTFRLWMDCGEAETRLATKDALRETVH